MTVTNFIWDELSDNVLLETDETDALTARYTNRPEQFGKLLSQYRIEDEKIVERFYHYDGESSTRDLTDSDENVTDTFIYTAYGEVVARTGTTTNPFGYKGAVGYYTNPDTDDIYVRARTYEPAIGRWLSVDPLGFVDGANLYQAYFVPRGIDPNGTVTRNIKPSTAKGMNWKKGNIAGANGQTQPINEKGAADFAAYNLKCDCCREDYVLGCHDYTCYSLKCTVNAYLRVVIDIADWHPINPLINPPPRFKKSQAYGHEQRHVQELLNYAEGAALTAKIAEDFATCVSRKHCKEMEALIEAEVNVILGSAIAAEIAHGGAIGMNEYPDPIGGIFGRRKDTEPGRLPHTKNCK